MHCNLYCTQYKRNLNLLKNNLQILEIKGIFHTFQNIFFSNQSIILWMIFILIKKKRGRNNYITNVSIKHFFKKKEIHLMEIQ